MFRLLIFSAIMLLFTAHAFSATAHPPKSPEKPSQTAARNILPKHEHTANCNETSAQPVQIICILDRSGSMKSLAEDTIGGYNSFIEKQKNEPGKAEVTTILFDDQYEKIADSVALNDVAELTSAEYYARGTTALLDAVGRTIMDTAGKMEREKICPAKRRVLIMIMTDGYENSSKEYRKADVKNLVETTTNDYKWNYVFIGANIDSVAEAGSIGIGANRAANYAPTGAGVEHTFAQMDEAAKDVRAKGSVSDDWKED